MVKCQICGKEFGDLRGLRMHVEKAHEDVKWDDYKERYKDDVERASEELKQRKRSAAVDPDDLEQLIERAVDKAAPRIAEKVYEKVVESLKEAEGGVPSEVPLPMEEAEVVGEKVNYRIS